MKAYDPEKFTMEVAHGVKNLAEVERLGGPEFAPDVMKPFCKAHRAWPCRYCGTSHFEGCTCPVCVEPDNEALKRRAVIEQVEYALTAVDALRAALTRLRDEL